MAGFKDKMGKFKDWMITDDDNSEEEYETYDYEEEENYDDYDDHYEEHEGEHEILGNSYTTSTSRVTEYSSHNQMKVLILEPRVYDDAQIIADNLKMRKTVIVNFEKITQNSVKKSIFNFMNGADYVLDGSIQEVSKSIFILAPKNVDVDSSMKKELESKASFPWQAR